VKKIYFWIFAVILIIIFILFVLQIFTTNSSGPAIAPAPKPSQGDNLYVNPQTKQKLNQEYLVSNLINHIPYQGKFFTLDYNFNNATFLLTFDKNNLNEANAEFNAYLKINSIADKSWFDNLVTSYK